MSCNHQGIFYCINGNKKGKAYSNKITLFLLLNKYDLHLYIIESITTIPIVL